MKELSPEELLDQVAQKRAELEMAMDMKDGDGPSPIPTATTKKSHEGGVFAEDDQKTHLEQQSSLDKDVLEAIKPSGALESRTQRNASHISPGAFEVAANYDTTSDGGRGRLSGTVATTDHEEDTLDDPPIRAILVDSSNTDDEETAADSIYTAEPMGSIIFKDRPFYRKKWHLLIVGSCALGMLTIIAGSVVIAVLYGSEAKSRAQRQSPDLEDEPDVGGGRYREYNEYHEYNNHDDRLYSTHHALIFGTNAQEFLLSDKETTNSADDSAIYVSVSCHDGANIDLLHWSSDAINCQSLDSHAFDCAIPLRNETLEFLTYVCFGKKPPRDEPVTKVDLDVPSLLDKGDAAYIHLIRFCDDPLAPNDSSMECQSPDPAILPTEFLGACKIPCPDGCDFQALEYNSCRADRIDQNSNQVSNMVDAIRMNLTNAIFSS